MTETKTCATCGHYMGGGDWNLCCDIHYELCYRNTPACDDYIYDENGSQRLAERDRILQEYVQRMSRK